jgi:hypothetical protein
LGQNFKCGSTRTKIGSRITQGAGSIRAEITKDNDSVTGGNREESRGEECKERFHGMRIFKETNLPPSKVKGLIDKSHKQLKANR